MSFIFKASRTNTLLFRKTHRFFASNAGGDNIQDVVVIGGGPGGYACAIKAAQLGLKTSCIEGRGTLGGTCLNVGCIPSKSLLNNTHLYHMASHDFKNRGIVIDGKINIDLKQLMTSKENSVNGLTKGIEGLFKKNKVNYIKGWGKILNKNEIQVINNDKKDENVVIKAKNIVIATGSTSTQLPNIKINESNIVTSTGALSFKEIPKNLIVVGAGVIGLELGSVWNRLGSNVTVVEFLDRICPGMDSDICRKFQTILKKQGIKFEMQKAVQSVEEQSNGTLKVKINDIKANNKELFMECDKILIAIGRNPFTDNLGLENLSKNILDDKKKFIKVKNNHSFQLLDFDNIYAIGDVIPGPMLAHKAEDEGIAVAEILAGKAGHINYNAVPSVIYTYPEVASVGKTEDELKSSGIEYNKGEFPFLANSRARTNADSEGLVKILADKKTDKLLGAHIIGPNAGEMIAEAVIGLEYGAASEDIARTVHAHPTLSEAFREACMDSCQMKPIHF